MKLKKLLLGASLVALGAVTLSSCGSSTVRNTVTPYGTFNSKLNDTIATASGDLKMTFGQYYTQLRKSGYSTITTAINKNIYKAELEVITGLYNNATRADFITNVGKDKLSVLECTDVEGDSKTAQEKLYDLTSDTTEANDKYLSLRKDLVKTITTTIVNAIYSKTSSKEIDKMTQDDKDSAVKKYIDTLADEGIFINASDIELDNSLSYFTKDDDLPALSTKTATALKDKIDTILLEQARYLGAKKELYKIADEEYIYDEDSEDDIKNSNYLYKEATIKSRYESSYKTYGEYNAIIIQFNSRKEALETINNLGVDFSNLADVDAAKNAYIQLYNAYYGYKQAASTDDEEFIYTVNKDKNDLSKLPSGINTLITSVLEDGQYLTEPRNINNKYVMALRISTKYDYNNGTDLSKEVEFASLSDEQKTKVTKIIKEDMIKEQASYAATVDHARYKDANIQIYDPYFEYSFYNAYPEEYTLVTSTVTNSTNEIFKIGDYSYTVEDFYKDASKKYSNDIITKYFELEFANSYYDKYVSLYMIDSDLAETNTTTLDEEISKFNGNNNSSYPKEVGLETFLLGTYGYTTREDVLKYYYNANKALTTYEAMKVYDSWRSSSTNADGNYYVSDEAKNGFLNNLLAAGNTKYDDLLSINLDHFLINIDDDADGSPDDPDTFLASKTTAEIQEFEEAVVNLARALYLETINPIYTDSSLFDTLKFIKTQYEEGNEMKSSYTINSKSVSNWDDFKKENKYNFLITVEQLASSGNIDEDSVNNFVTPFKDYVVEIYKSVTSLDNDTYRKKASSGDGYEYENGKFYLITDANNNEGCFVTTDADATKITADTLCKTSFGYHMLIINSYENKSYLTYTKDDASEYQQNIELTLRTYTDSDDNEQTIKLNIDSLNEPATSGEECTTASFNQFFIYYVQNANGVSTSLDSTIYELMGKLFDDVISAYTNTYFQEFLILNKLDIKISTDDVLKQDIITAHVNKVKNTITNYEKDSEFNSWVDGTYDWTRPDVKAN
ncbi:MAG: hypothetical protein IJS83_06915 [Acholeplasmatales bacterium]|nr:hypothetical protein [Acholeplasmatales bacterium]